MLHEKELVARMAGLDTDCELSSRISLPSLTPTPSSDTETALKELRELFRYMKEQRSALTKTVTDAHAPVSS